MAEHHVEVVRRAFAAFAAGMYAPQDSMDPAFTWHTAAGWVGDAEYRGLDAFRAFVADWADSFEGFSFEARELRALGEEVLARVHVGGRGRDSGLEVDWEFGVLFSEFRDGRVADARAFMDWQSALRAAGLTE